MTSDSNPWDAPEEKLIAIMGPTGAGKSSFINLLGKGDDGIKVGHGLQSCTANVSVAPSFTLGGHRIRLIDTPGFDDTNRTNTEILEIISQYLDITYRSGRQLSGLIYLHKITDNRMGGISFKNLKMFHKLCGDGALKNVVLCTTMWDLVDVKVGEEREDELREKFWARMIQKGASITRHDGSSQSACDILTSMLDFDPVSLKIQQELVDDHKTLLETTAGGEINREMLEMKEGYERLLAEAKRDWEEAMRARDADSQRLIEEDRKIYEAKLIQMRRDHDALTRDRDEEMIRLMDRIKQLEAEGKGDFWENLNSYIGSLMESIRRIFH